MDTQTPKVEKALSALDSIRHAVPSFPQGNARELVQNGEVVVALENLCDNLFELEVQLPISARRALVEACESASVNESYWKEFKAPT